MRPMKDSKIKWIGQIPDSWCVERLKYHAYFNPATELPEFSDDDEVSFVPMDHLKSGFHNTSMVPYQKVKKGYVVFQDNDILMAKVTPCLENGNLAIAGGLNHGVGFGSTEINVIRCRSIDRRFLFYVLQCPSYIEEATYNMYGVAGLKRLDPWFIPNSFCQNPPQEEQIRIAEYLDNKCAEIDLLIAAKEKTNALLRERRQSIIYEAVTKGLDPNAPMKDSGVEWIGEIPEGWELKRLKYLGSMQIGLTYSPEEIVADGALVLRSSNIQDGIIVHADDVFVGKEIPEKLKVEEGDILICSRNGSRSLIGKNAVITEEFSGQTFGAFMTIFRGRLNFYIKYLLNSSVFDYYVGSFLTSTINQLTTSNLGNILVPVPSTEEEMWKNAEHIETECRTIDPIIAMNNETIQKLKEYRQSLIYEAVTGKIEV